MPRLAAHALSIGLAAALFALGVAVAPPARAQSAGDALPEMGSSAATLITPAEEARYGAMILRELRRQDALVEDPLVEGWLQGLGFRVAAASAEPDHGYTFFMMRDRRINAFATLGGLVGMTLHFLTTVL